MTRSTKHPENVAVRALWLLVADHGDAFRFSISKRGRIWLTLTHWDTEKYNTSVELDPLDDVDDFLLACTVLCAAHYIKCFRSGAHADTWLGIQATRDMFEDASTIVTSMLQSAPTDTTGTNVDTEKGGHVPTS